MARSENVFSLGHRPRTGGYRIGPTLLYPAARAAIEVC